MLDAAARSRGGKAAAAARRAAKAVRTLSPDAAPPEPRSLDDAVALAAKVSRAVLVGEVDPATARECIRAVSEFRRSLEQRDLARELAALRQQVKTLRKAKP